MQQKKRVARTSAPWCGDLTAHSPEGEGSAFRGGKKVAKRGSVHHGRKKREGKWAEKAEEDSSSSSTGDSCRRVIVVIDHTPESKLALKWSLTHVVQQADVLTLLHVQPFVNPRQFSAHGSFLNAKAAEDLRRKNEVAAWELANTFKAVVSSCRPEVEVEISVIEGEKGPTIVAQSKKLEASILVLGQKKPSVLWRIVKRKKESLADYCINNSDCLTLAVRKKSRRLGGYLINSQWQKNFWLLA